MKEDDEPDFLEQEIAERTTRNPDYPRLLAEAEERLANSLPIEEIRRLTLEPGDILVIKVPGGMAYDVVEQIATKANELLPDQRVMIVPADWDLETIRKKALGVFPLDDSSPSTS